MNAQDFSEKAPGKLVKGFENGRVFQAFVPAPLPPSLELTTDLFYVLSMADRSLGELAGLGRNLANPQLFIRPFVRREAVSSSRIEGTQADLKDLYVYEAGQLSPPIFEDNPLKHDAREVLNYVRALEYGLERLQEFPLSLRLLRELHTRLLEGVRGEFATPGEFRKRQNYIGSPQDEIVEARFVPPPVSELNSSLAEFELYLHFEDRLPPLIRLALIHYQFETIHPFLDGNGRIGRLLISLLLVYWNLLPLPLLYLSAYFERHRGTYYDLLLAVSQRGTWEDWLIFFLRGVAEQAEDANSKARELQQVQVEWREVLQKNNLSGWAFGLLETLFRLPIITAGEVSQQFGVVHQTAMRTLRRFTKMGILVEVELPGLAGNNQIAFVAERIVRLFA